jgi:hypothetical protein
MERFLPLLHPYFLLEIFAAAFAVAASAIFMGVRWIFTAIRASIGLTREA